MIETLNLIGQVVSVIFFLVMISQILSHIVRQQRITPRVILEAINGYLLLGLGFSVLVGLAMRIGEQAFSFSAETVGVIVHHDFIYIAFVTMSTHFPQVGDLISTPQFHGSSRVGRWLVRLFLFL